jgi:hypothetical protein
MGNDEDEENIVSELTLFIIPFGTTSSGPYDKTCRAQPNFWVK